MRWTTAFLFFGAVATVLSTEEVSDESEPLLHVLARPSTFNAGERRAIFCQGRNLPHAINWYSPSGNIVGERSSTNNRVYVERKVDNSMVMVPLIIHEVKVEDSGSWTCKAGEYNETIDIVVGIKVKFHNRQTTMEGDEGKNAKLTCEAKGYPLPVIQWYKDGKLLTDKTSPSKYAMKKKGDIYVLEVRALTYEDIGEYLCKVTQKVLSYYTDKTIILSVKHAPVLVGTYKTVEEYAAFNATKNITCSAIANPLPSYQWYRRRKNFDTEIPEEDTIFTAEDGTSSTLMLRMDKEEAFGEYKCKVSNSKGSETVIFDVSLGERPTSPDGVNLIAANSTHLTFNVSCAACPIQQSDDTSPDPKNLTVIGFDFELTEVRDDYPPDWDKKYPFEMLIEESEDLVFAVGPLPNSTVFHARVRTRNLAGESDWLEVQPDPATTSRAVTLSLCLAIIVAAFIATTY
ncbi:unnamed protein product [Chilo suppressalis]|uniref:Ig-like domain-containing protein n=1 Tax=Chilo suppressalis TaxID=168631 RepID=A0ABN8L825_CHISP|nr:unnamed protein product [Chilo suppressalis]